MTEIEDIRRLALAALMTKPEGDDSPWPWQDADPVPGIGPYEDEVVGGPIGSENPWLIAFLDEQRAFMARMNPAAVIVLCDLIEDLRAHRNTLIDERDGTT